MPGIAHCSGDIEVNLRDKAHILVGKMHNKYRGKKTDIKYGVRLISTLNKNKIGQKKKGMLL